MLGPLGLSLQPKSQTNLIILLVIVFGVLGNTWSLYTLDPSGGASGTFYARKAPVATCGTRNVRLLRESASGFNKRQLLSTNLQIQAPNFQAAVFISSTSLNSKNDSDSSAVDLEI